MTRTVRHLYAAAAVVGFGLSAGIAQAADSSTYSPSATTSPVQLVSATDSMPPGDESSARPPDPRSSGSDADSYSSRTATYPPKKPLKQPPAKSAPKPSAKPFNGGPDLSDAQAP